MPAQSRPSVFATNKTVKVDSHARNALVDDYTQVAPYMAARRSSAPTLFPGGDLPKATASGNPPSELLQLPWQLRHAAARADQAEWARLMNTYAGNPDADIEMMFEPAADDPANWEYKARVSEWARA
jgi:hypothetical protein